MQWWTFFSICTITIIIFQTCLYLNGATDKRRLKERVRITTSSIYAVTLVLWPIIFLYVANIVSPTYLLSTANGDTIILPFMFALVWPALLILWDLIDTSTRRRELENDETNRYMSNKSTAAIIVGGAWAIGSLMTIVNGRSGGHTTESAQVILLSLVMCIAFVLPVVGDGSRRSVSSINISAIQKASMNYAVGFFILGIAMAWEK